MARAEGMTMTRFQLPAEWASHRALWVGWPHLVDEWGGTLSGAREQIAGFVRAASAFVPVRVACGSDEALTSAQEMMGGAADCVRVPCGDIWLRDTGPIITRGAGGLLAQLFRFNGWGEKYIMPGDTETAAGIASAHDLPMCQHEFILEGGAIDCDGEGRILTTGECLLNVNRNGWSKADAEAALSAAFGTAQMIWLGEGLLNDHTDGHVDNIARFVGPGHAVCQSPSGDDDPNTDRLLEIEDALRQAGLNVSTIASPGRIVSAQGEIMPASHMNFTITNGAVLVPVYEDRFAHVALAELRAVFPEHTVIGLPADEILCGGGSFHCMTREIPA